MLDYRVWQSLTIAVRCFKSCIRYVRLVEGLISMCSGHECWTTIFADSDIICFVSILFNLCFALVSFILDGIYQEDHFAAHGAY